MLNKFYPGSYQYNVLALVFLLIVLRGPTVSAQCYPDRHNTTAANSWLTCEASQSLNAARGVSHWILYDLGQVLEMGKMHFWNLNHPQMLDQGAKTMVVDYSRDGVTWEEWGSLDLEMAEASGFYEGIEVADLERLRARMLLLTITENHGGDCYGFAEVRVETFQSLNDDDLLADAMFSLSPNPASDYARLILSDKATGAAQVTLINALGQEVYASTLNMNGGARTLDLDLTGLSPGNYFVKVVTASQEWVEELSVVSN